MTKNLTSIEAAGIIGITPNTLMQWRGEGKGPRFTKSGHTIVYDFDDVCSFAQLRKSLRDSQKRLKNWQEG